MKKIIFMCPFSDYLKKESLNFSLICRTINRFKTCPVMYFFKINKKKAKINRRCIFSEITLNKDLHFQIYVYRLHYTRASLLRFVGLIVQPCGFIAAYLNILHETNLKSPDVG